MLCQLESLLEAIGEEPIRNHGVREAWLVAQDKARGCKRNYSFINRWSLPRDGEDGVRMF